MYRSRNIEGGMVYEEALVLSTCGRDLEPSICDTPTRKLAKETQSNLWQTLTFVRCAPRATSVPCTLLLEDKCEQLPLVNAYYLRARIHPVIRSYITAYALDTRVSRCPASSRSIQPGRHFRCQQANVHKARPVSHRE